MATCFKLQGNRDIEPCVTAMLSCIAKPHEAGDTISKLSATTFVQVHLGYSIHTQEAHLGCCWDVQIACIHTQQAKLFHFHHNCFTFVQGGLLLEMRHACTHAHTRMHVTHTQQPELLRSVCWCWCRKRVKARGRGGPKALSQRTATLPTLASPWMSTVRLCVF